MTEVNKWINTNNLDYIIDAVERRGIDQRNWEDDDFSKLLQRKDFQELVMLEIYETYFFGERHEYDFQLIEELVKAISNFFSDPTVIANLNIVKEGLLQNIPTEIIIFVCGLIIGKMKSNNRKHDTWGKLQENAEKLDNEFKNHDYILSEDIEQVFGVSRGEMECLFKLSGYKHYVKGKSSIWIKPGVSEERLRTILKNHNFKVK
jgi:hypothetical protein